MCSGCPGDVENPDRTAPEDPIGGAVTRHLIGGAPTHIADALQRWVAAEIAVNEALAEFRNIIRAGHLALEELLAAGPTAPGPHPPDPGHPTVASEVGALEDAIGLEDGLDSAEGDAVRRMLLAALRPFEEKP